MRTRSTNYSCSRIFRTAISPASSSTSASRGRAFKHGNRSRAWTDWSTLDYSINGVRHDVRWIGTPSITFTCNTTGRMGASATFTLNMASPQAGDKITLWYQNQSFISPAIVSGNPTTDQALWWQGSVATTDQALWWQGNAAYNHWAKIGSATYSWLENSLNSAGMANNTLLRSTPPIPTARPPWEDSITMRS